MEAVATWTWTWSCIILVSMHLGVDVGGSKVAAAVVDQTGRLTGRVREVIDQTDEQSAILQVEKIIAGFSSYPLQGIGVCVPGIADRRTGTVWAPNVRGWNHIPLQERLQRGAAVPLSIESDRNAAVLAELFFGAARGRQDVLVLIIGTGIGAGILAGGRLVRGCQDVAGAVGWVPVPSQGAVAHFEEVAAGPAIERAAAKRTGAHRPLPELAAACRSGERTLQEVFDHAGEAIGMALASMVSLFNPELIVIGGGVSSVWTLLESSALGALQRWSQPVAVRQVGVTVSPLGPDAGILGAAAAARRQ
jgi:glucokinase